MKAWADLPYHELSGRRLDLARAALHAGFPAIARMTAAQRALADADGQPRCVHCSRVIPFGAIECAEHAGSRKLIVA